MNIRHLSLAYVSILLVALLAACNSQSALQPPAGSSGGEVPLYPDARKITVSETDRVPFIKETFGSDYLLYSSETNIAWTKDTGATVKGKLDKLLPDAKWRVEADWSGYAQFYVSIWRKGDLKALIAYLDNLTSEQIDQLNRRYGISVPETGSTLIVTHLWDTTQPIPTATPTITPTRPPTATPTSTPTPSLDILNKLKSGSYRVEVTGLHSTWILDVAGSLITGTSEWDCCPGNRIDPLNGRIEGDRVIIERDCTGQGSAGECHQVYVGTLVGDVITGSFTGTGATANASWTLSLKP